MNELFTFMAQRDDARSDTEKAYWSGYIDAVADVKGWNVAEAEAAYQLMQVEAAHSMSAISGERDD